MSDTNNNIHTISILLQSWYPQHKRDLPWRHTSDPYLIWVSEVILQQTRVEQGYDYFVRFVRKFPDIWALASASEEDVLKIWQGLGYYSRAPKPASSRKTIDQPIRRHISERFREDTLFERGRQLHCCGHSFLCLWQTTRYCWRKCQSGNIETVRSATSPQFHRREKTASVHCRSDHWSCSSRHPQPSYDGIGCNNMSSPAPKMRGMSITNSLHGTPSPFGCEFSVKNCQNKSARSFFQLFPHHAWKWNFPA